MSKMGRRKKELLHIIIQKQCNSVSVAQCMGLVSPPPPGFGFGFLPVWPTCSGTTGQVKQTNACVSRLGGDDRRRLR